MPVGKQIRPLTNSISRELLARATTVSEVLADLAQGYPDLECLTLADRQGNETRITLENLWSRAKAVQAALVARGLRPDGCVVVILPTGVELLAGYFGAMLGGGIPSLAATPSHRISDPQLYLRTVGHMLENARAEVVYCDDDVAELLLERPSLLGDTKILRPAEVGACEKPPETVRRAPHELATIQYSSGSTDVPRGVQLTHRAILNYTRLLREGLEISSDDVSVNWLPLYHDMGLFGAFLIPLLCGCRTILIPTMDFLREPVLWLRAIHKYRGTMSWSPNFAYSFCASRISDSELTGIDLSSWRLALNGSEPVLASTIEAFAKRFQPYGYRSESMSSTYGLAEGVMAVTVHPVREPPLVEIIDREVLAVEGRAEPTEGEGFASVATGECLPNCEIEIRGGGGEKLGDRQVGDIWLRTNCLFSGYRDNPELTAQVLVDGWLNCGDRGYTVDGQLFFVSRTKDLIVIGGKKYAPHDVESAINRVPHVRQGCAIAFGVMNENLGTEELAAVVETREVDTDSLERLARAIRQEVARTIGLGIRHLKLVSPGGVEKTTSGKLARGATRGRYASEFA